MCGTADWEWDPKQGGSKFAYEAVARHCQGCYVKDATTEDTERRPGLIVELHPTGTVESARRLVAAKERQANRQRRKTRDPSGRASATRSERTPVRA